MDTFTKWMANTATTPPGEKPSWIEDPSENTEDVLSAPFTPREVVDQLRRLPGKSAPGPDRITYWQWKQLVFFFAGHPTRYEIYWRCLADYTCMCVCIYKYIAACSLNIQSQLPFSFYFFFCFDITLDQ